MDTHYSINPTLLSDGVKKKFILYVHIRYKSPFLSRKIEETFNLPFWYGKIPSISENVGFKLTVQSKSLNWSPTQCLEMSLYINPLQQLSSKHKCPHSIKVTSWGFNRASVDFFISKVSRFMYNAAFSIPKDPLGHIQIEQRHTTNTSCKDTILQAPGLRLEPLG